jgi:chemotaxis signal transduction protein
VSAAGILVVRAGAERFAVDLAAVEEVVELGAPVPVPGCLPAFRGVVRWRTRHVAVLHLGALVGGTAPPPARGDTALVVRFGGAPVALEVDEVVDVVEGDGVAAGAEPTAGTPDVRVVAGALVTQLDLEALAARTAEQGGIG